MGGAEEQSPAVLNRIAQAVRSGRFPLVRKGEALPPCEARIWGIRRDVGEERVFALPLSEVDRLAGTAGTARDLVAYWAENDLLLPSPDGKNTRQLQVTGWSDQRQRLACLKRSAFQVSRRAR
jgi:hypothetical protein